MFDKGICIKFLVFLFVSNHPNEPPIITIQSGSSLILVGRTDSRRFIGSSHSNAAPHVIDIADIRIIGNTTFGLSSIPLPVICVRAHKNMHIVKRIE